MPGEGEILGQVRLAFEAGAAGPMLDRLFRQALYAGRRPGPRRRSARAPASISSAAAALAQQVFGDLRGRRILLVGAGKVSEQAARNFLSRGAEIAVVANRARPRAEELAERFGTSAIGLDRIDDELASADIVVASTSAPGFVVSATGPGLGARRGKPLLLIDLAVPRDLDPDDPDSSGVYLYDLDDLEQVVSADAHRSSPRGRSGRVDRCAGGGALPRLAGVARRRPCDRVASCVGRGDPATELAKAEARLGRFSDSERRAVEAMTTQIVNKLLHRPTVRMKEAAAAADGVVYADAVRHLFGLEDER